MTVLVTGGAGFIGSEFVHELYNSEPDSIAIVDSLTYAGNLNNLKSILPNIRFHNVDICDVNGLAEVFRLEKPNTVVHFAAESHVDNSISSPNIFLETNVGGTLNILKLSVQHGVEKYIHISTDEVYGSMREGKAVESNCFNPASPYSASKAAAEHFVNAWSTTYGLPTFIVRCSNNYGPRQHVEKLIPLAINRLINQEKVPIYGDGSNVREWIHVSDCAKAILAVMNSKEKSKVYNISSGDFRTNLEIVRELIQIFGLDDSYIEFVEDRKGHDYRYAIDSSRILNELNWKPTVSLSDGLRETVDWFKTSRNK